MVSNLTEEAIYSSNAWWRQDERMTLNVSLAEQRDSAWWGRGMSGPLEGASINYRPVPVSDMNQ